MPWAERSHLIWFFLAAVLAVGLAGARPLQLEWRDAGDWIQSLENPKRITELRIDERLAPLRLKPAEIVADIGAGSGVFSRAIARAVAPTGKVLAVEIQQALLDFINQRARQERIENIETILGEFDDPVLPTREVDLAFIHDVFHAIEHREAYLKALVSYLKPTGRIAIIDWVKSDHNALKFHEDLEILISKDEAKQMLAAIGFYPVAEFDHFSLSGIKQWYVIFARH